MAITRTAMVDDDGTGTTGTIVNNAWKTEFYNQIDATVPGASSTVVINALGIGSAPPAGEKIYVNQPTGSVHLVTFENTAATGPYGLHITFTGAAPNNGSNYFVRCSDSVTARCVVYSNGGIANFQSNDLNLSDATVKAITGPAPPQRADFRRLAFVVGRYLGATRDCDDVMLTAQDVETVFPTLVEPFADTALKGVREHALLLRACKVIQELDDALETVLRRVAALEAAHPSR